MFTPDDFEYASENTRIVVPPQKRLATFGASMLHYYLVTEAMDEVSRTRVREGEIHADRPQLISPAYFSKLMLEGFGDDAEEYANGLEHANLKFLQYGFRMRKADLHVYDVHEPMGQVLARVESEVLAEENPFATVLSGIEEGWEVSLLKLMVAMIHHSAAGNLRDLNERGLL